MYGEGGAYDGGRAQPVESTPRGRILLSFHEARHDTMAGLLVTNGTGGPVGALQPCMLSAPKLRHLSEQKISPFFIATFQGVQVPIRL